MPSDSLDRGMLRRASAILFYLLCMRQSTGHRVREGVEMGVALRTADLSSWLYNLKLPVGNVSQTLEGSQIELSNVICTHFEISGLQSNFEPKVQITIHVAKLELFCFGGFAVTTHIPIIGNVHSKGSFNLTAHTDADLDITIVQNFSNTDPPHANSTCKVSTKVDKMHFFGHGIQAFIIELLTPLLKPFLPLILDPKICNTINTLVGKNFTSILNTIDHILDLPIPPPLPAPKFPSTILPLGILEGISEYLFSIFGPEGPFSIPLVVAWLTNGTGVIDMKPMLQLGPLQLADANVTALIRELNVEGLNTTELLEIIQPEDKFFLDTVFSVKNLYIYMNLTVTVSLEGFEPLTQTFTLAVSANNMTLGGSVLLGVDTLSILNSTLYELSQLSCFADDIDVFNVSYFNSSVILSAVTANASGLLESELADLVDSVLEYVLLDDGLLITKTIERLANSQLRTMVNTFVNEYINSQKILCGRYPPEPVFDWRNFDPVKLLSGINDQSLNTALATLAPAGSLKLPLNKSFSVTTLGISLGLVLNELDFTGLSQTFYNTSFLKPLGHTDISGNFGVGHHTPLGIYADIHFSLNGASPMTHLIINETISRLHFAILQDIKLNNDFLKITLLELLENHDLISTLMLEGATKEAECFVANYVENWNFTLTELELRYEHTEIFHEGRWLFLKDLLYDISPTLYQLAITVAHELPSTLTTTVNEKISGIRHDAPYYCDGKLPPPENGSDNSTIPNWALALGVLGTTWSIVVLIAVGGWRAYRRRKKQEELLNKDLSLDESKHTQPLLVTQTVDYLPWTSLRAYYPVGEKYGLLIQILVPLLILATLAVKIWALVANVTRVRLKVDLSAGNTVVDSYIIDFTFSNMVQYFWKSEAYLISILIVTGSCVVPLILGLTLFLVWFVPSRPSYRGRVLLFFTQAGKGSYIDIMFLCYIILVMKQKLNLAGTKATVTAEPVQGIFGGIASTTANLLLCHLLFYLHNTKLEEKPHPTNNRSSLWKMHVRRDLGAENANGWKSWLQFVSLVLVLITSAICIVVVVFQSNITWFKLTGVLAEIPDRNRYDIIKQYNLYAFPQDLPKNTDKQAGAYCIAVVYTILSLINPLVILVGWIILWVVPLRKDVQRIIYAMLQRIWSFSGLEVFWIASFAAVLEINKVAVWILNHTLQGWCGDAGNLANFCDLLEPLANSGDFLHVDAKFLPGGYWLLAQCILYYLICNATLYYGGMLLGNTSRNGWVQPPIPRAKSTHMGTPWGWKNRKFTPHTM